MYIYRGVRKTVAYLKNSIRKRFKRMFAENGHCMKLRGDIDQFF